MEDSSAVLVDFYGFLRWYGVYCEYCLYLYLWFDYLSPAGFETQMLHSLWVACYITVKKPLSV